MAKFGAYAVLVPTFDDVVKPTITALMASAADRAK
jgi:hypothetical protein